MGQYRQTEQKVQQHQKLSHNLSHCVFSGSVHTCLVSLSLLWVWLSRHTQLPAMLTGKGVPSAAAPIETAVHPQKSEQSERTIPPSCCPCEDDLNIYLQDYNSTLIMSTEVHVDALIIATEVHVDALIIATEVHVCATWCYAMKTA